jgi:undecaprenyl diphosphate synthase
MKHDLKHLAIIMDGNARWAKLNNLSKAEGHKKGAEVAKSLINYIPKLGIEYLTLYTFSSENWNRPLSEVSILIELLSHYVLNEVKLLNQNNLKLKVIGNLEKLSTDLQNKIQKAISDTSQNSVATVCIAFSYGGREEIITACRRAMEAGRNKITEDNFKKFLYDPDMPDVDLLIRTGNNHRISNFLLWQMAYAELYFCDKYWPEFDASDLEKSIENYHSRQRNFGGR